MLITQTRNENIAKPVTKTSAIKSFIYYAPPLEAAKIQSIDTKPLNKAIRIDPLPSATKKAKEATTKSLSTAKNTNASIEKSPREAMGTEVNRASELPKASHPPPESTSFSEPVKKKLDSFTQLQRLRSKLNQGAASKSGNPYQRYQAPSVFNSTPKLVPHSAPLKDDQAEQEKNTKNIGAGIAITKGDDGRCSVTQDMSAYGLSEGSSTQFFSCGESKFDQGFREHMKKVKAKLGQK